VPLDRCRQVLTPYAIVGPHPNIDGLKEIVMGSTCAYAMHGTLTTCSEDLHAYVRRRRRLAEPEAARLFAQILEAVAHCHLNGVVVRDIKLRRFLFADDEK
jgi:tribbles homolog 1/2